MRKLARMRFLDFDAIIRRYDNKHSFQAPEQPNSEGNGMVLKAGDRIKYKSCNILYSPRNNYRGQSGFEIKEVLIVASARGTDFNDASDWIVCYPRDYPIKDLTSRYNSKHWGISENQITEIVNRV